jgi:hypothetical protein
MRDVRSGTAGRRARTRAQHQRNLRLIRQYKANPNAPMRRPGLTSIVKALRAHRGNVAAEAQIAKGLPEIGGLRRGGLASREAEAAARAEYRRISARSNAQVARNRAVKKAGGKTGPPDLAQMYREAAARDAFVKARRAANPLRKAGYYAGWGAAAVPMEALPVMFWGAAGLGAYNTLSGIARQATGLQRKPKNMTPAEFEKRSPWGSPQEEFAKYRRELRGLAASGQISGLEADDATRAARGASLVQLLRWRGYLHSSYNPPKGGWARPSTRVR